MPAQRQRSSAKALAAAALLLASGSAWAQTPTFSMLVNPATVEVCSNQLGSTTVRVAAMNGFTNSVFLSAPFSGNNWVLDGFVPNPITNVNVNPTTSFMRVLFFPQASGQINIPVTGQDLTTGFTRFGTARFDVTMTPPPTLLTRLFSPEPPGANNPPDPPPPTDINWHPLYSWSNILMPSYELIVRKNQGNELIESEITAGSSRRFSDALEASTEYRTTIRGFNHCGSASTSSVQFTTAQACFFADRPIPDGGGMLIDGRSVAGNIAEGLRVTLSIEHPRVSDLRVSLMRLDRSGILIDQPGLPGAGCNRGGLEAVLRDTAPRGNESECASEGPAVNGQLRPTQPLSAFEGVAASGEWTLVVEDLVGGQNGRLVEWCLSSGNAPGDDPFQADGLHNDGFE